MFLFKRRMTSTTSAVGSDQPMKDSYDDRICDDLSQIILQFLDLKDKIKLECVSKRFQRTIYHKHSKLKIDPIMTHGFRHFYVSMETLVKKLPNITAIDIKWSNVSTYNWTQSGFVGELNRTLEMVVNNCSGLRRLATNVNLDERIADLITQRFGTKLIEYRWTGPLLPMNPTIRVPALTNLSSLEIRVMTFDWFRFSDIHMKNLRSLTAYINDYPDWFIIFLERHNNLRRLAIDSSRDPYYVTELFQTIGRLDQLVDLTLGSTLWISRKHFKELVACVGQTCPRIKRLSIHLTDNLESLDQQNSLMAPFKEFKSLTRLELNIDHLSLPHNCDNHLFKDFPQLTHLSLKSFTLVENILSDMATNLTSLQHLSFYRFHDINLQITANSLNKLPKLKSVQIKTNNENVKKNIAYVLSKMCPKIKFINVSM